MGHRIGSSPRDRTIPRPQKLVKGKTTVGPLSSLNTGKETVFFPPKRKVGNPLKVLKKELGKRLVINPNSPWLWYPGKSALNPGNLEPKCPKTGIKKGFSARKFVPPGSFPVVPLTVKKGGP